MVARQQYCSRVIGKACLRLCSTSACLIIEVVKVRKKTTIRNQYTQVPHLTHNTICESDRTHEKHHTEESQEVSLFPARDHKAEMYGKDKHETQITKWIRTRSTARKITGGLSHVFNLINGGFLPLQVSLFEFDRSGNTTLQTSPRHRE